MIGRFQGVAQGLASAPVSRYSCGMTGSVWERKDGRFGAEFRYKVGSATKTLTTTKSTRETAEAWLADKETDHADGVVSGNETVGRFLDAWLEESVAPRVSRNTYRKREGAVRVHIKPEIGAIPISELDVRRVQGLYSLMAREGYAYPTRREIHVTLKVALSQAVRWGLVRRNVCDLADPPRDLRRGHEEEEIRHLTDAEARGLFRSSEATESRWRYYYIVAVRSGLRPGEMLGLRWGDLDLTSDPGSLRVRRTLDTHSEPVFNPPKSPAARRTVALHFKAKGAFLSQRAMLRDEGLRSQAGDLVFPSAAGSPRSSDNLRKRSLKSDLARAGLPDLTLHELRHTFASIMLHEWLVPPAIVSQMLGHKSIAFTFDLYRHLIPTAQADTMRRLNDLHRPQNGPKSA